MDEKIAGKTKFGEIDIDSLRPCNPTCPRVMRQYTERYGIMCHACRARNWDLGLYQLKGIREIAEVGKKTRPKWKQELEDFDRKFLVPHRKRRETQGLDSLREGI